MPPENPTLLLHEGEGFGSLSCLSGTRHTATAIVQSASDVWVLRRGDLAALLNHEVTTLVGV